MVICDETNRLYIVTSSKKIVVYDTETQEKICETVSSDAHTESIYGIALATAANAATVVTCSADNTIKTWEMLEENKELINVSTLTKYEGRAEEVNQLLNLVCFEENDAMKIIAASL